MFNVCVECGSWTPAKTVLSHSANPQQAFAVCDQCQHHHPFAYLPLFIVTGASGSGKSTICQRLSGSMRKLVVLESDILWGVAYSEPEEWPQYRNMWLRLCKNIHQSGRSVLLIGAGMHPNTIESCPEHRYFSAVHYLALVANASDLTTRLRARPQWRQSSHDEFVQAQLSYNNWFIEQSELTSSPMRSINTSTNDVSQICEMIRNWVGQHLNMKSV